MSSLVGDLWPADLVKVLPISPMSIMKEQAIRLGGKTGELVQADVRPEILGNYVELEFELVMPLFENYRYSIIKVSHPVECYFSIHMFILGETVGGPIANEAEFVGHLREALGSERVKNVIRTFVDMQSSQSLPPSLPSGFAI